MFRRQRGVTLIGWVCLLIPVAIVGYAGHPPGAGLPQLHAGGALDGSDRTELKGEEIRPR
jgi:hypothetical protein